MSADNLNLVSTLMHNPLKITSSLLIAGLATLIAIPATAAVNVGGDVPQSGTGFGTITQDNNGDNIADTIDDQGNNVFDFLADPNNPGGGTGGLAWDDPLIWVDYETNQNILVGEVGSGSLEINGGSALRYQHLVLGGPRSGGPFTFSPAGSTQGIDLIAGGGEDFDFTNAISANNVPTSGVGVMTVTGFGSIFNNAPAVVPGEFVTALGAAGFTSSAINPTPDTSSRPIDGGTQSGGGYDVHVGLTGSGVLNVDSGGAVQIQDALFIGLGDSASGTVTVDGFGSSITAYGRDEFDDANDQSTGTTNFGSIIGGHGNGSLNITAGGRVDMFNGASLGASNSTSTLSGTNTGSGSVLLEGTGSVWNVYASQAINDLTGMTSIALAVGELRDRDTAFPTDPLGSGSLEIQTGARVNVSHSENYQGTATADAKMVVGFNGKVVMAGGILAVQDAIINDGNIQGYGQIEAGGDNALTNFTNTTLGTIDAGGSISTQTLDLQISGGFDNDGSVSGQGSVNSTNFYNGTQSKVSVTDNRRLSIIATGATARDPSTDGYSEFDASVADFRLMTDADGDNVVDTADAFFFQANIGSIEVRDAEIEFGRAQPSNPLAPVDRTEAFINGRFATVSAASMPFMVNATPTPGDPTTAFTGTGSLLDQSAIGTITSNGGTLDFSSNLFNTGVLAFTGGDSTVIGKVLNGSIDYDSATDTPVTSVAFDHDADPTTADRTFTAVNNQLILPGVIQVTGQDSTATFTSDVENEGRITIGPGGSVMNILGNFTNSGGEVDIFLDSVLQPSAVVVSGSILVDGGLLSAAASATASLSAGMAFPILSAGGALDTTSRFTAFDLPELADPLLQWNVVYDFGQDEIRLEIVDTLMAIVGADFNGDGVVDASDLAVWSANFGITMGASPFQGDADLDGDVDLNDFLLINQQIVTGVPVAASFSTSSSSAEAIPEPGSAILILIAASGMCGVRRRS